MDINHIVDALKQEGERIDAAISALVGGKSSNGRRRGRGKAAMAQTIRRRSKRRLSVAARKRISEAAKARWVKAKKAGKNSL